MRFAAFAFIVIFLMSRAPIALAQDDFVLKAACIGGYANTVTEVAAAADGTISRRHYYNSGSGDRTWNPLGGDPTRVARWLKQVDATKQRRATVPTTVDRNPCRVGSSRPCHILRRKDKVDYYACGVPAVVQEMMDFNAYTNAPRADGALKVIEQWHKAFVASDVDAIVKLFAPDALILADNSKTVVSGGAEIRKYFEDTIRTRKPVPPSPTTQQNNVLSEDAVLVTHYSVWTNPPSGQALPERLTFVLARRNGSWLILHLHSSATPN